MSKLIHAGYASIKFYGYYWGVYGHLVCKIHLLARILGLKARPSTPSARDDRYLVYK